MSTTGRFMLATCFTWPTKCGLMSQSGPSFHATWWAPTGWPTKRYSISLRQSMNTACGCCVQELLRFLRFQVLHGAKCSTARAGGLCRFVSTILPVRRRRAIIAGRRLTIAVPALTFVLSADLTLACGRFTNPAKAAFDGDPFGGKLNGFFSHGDTDRHQRPARASCSTSAS